MNASGQKKGLLIIHGPNLNLLGTREPEVYGRTTLADIDAHLAAIARQHDVPLAHFQSNHEGALVDRIQAARTDGTAFIIINPAAIHTPAWPARRLAAVALPFVEVHLSNVHRRESFRHHSYFSDLAVATVVGMGAFGYEAALRYALQELGVAPPAPASH